MALRQHHRGGLMRGAALLLLGLIGCAWLPVADGTPQHRLAEVPGGVIGYTDRCRAGEPPDEEALVFVHGWCSDRRVWTELLERFPQRRLIAIDLPGHGTSTPSTDGYGIDATAAAVLAVCDAAGVRRGHLVGHSNGASVVRQLWRRHPERVASITVIDGALRRPFDDAVGAMLAERLAGEDFAAFREQLFSSMLPRKAEPAVRRSLLQMAAAVPQPVALASFRATLEPRIWNDDPIAAPLLVLNAASPFWDDEYEAYLRRLAPQVRYHVIANVSHFMMQDDPSAVAALIEEFLGTLPAS